VAEPRGGPGNLLERTLRAARAAGRQVKVSLWEPPGDAPGLAAPEARVLLDRAEPLEALAGRPVGAAAASGFTHLLDGIQVTRLVAFLDHLPLVFAHVAAAIRERRERRMSTWGEPRRLDLVLAPEAVAPDGAVGVRAPGDTPEEVHPLRWREAIRREVDRLRETLERDLASRWIAEHDRAAGAGALLVDGGITDREAVSRRLHQHRAVVGVVKSHHTQYFAGAAQDLVWSLREGERSFAFGLRGPAGVEVLSWYLRLREPVAAPTFGLVRVEAARSLGLGAVDRISAWLLRERSPLSLPDGRWDKMVYPVRDVELYLRSLAPSAGVLTGALLRADRGARRA
jgi:hypothetical protein